MKLSWIDDSGYSEMDGLNDYGHDADFHLFNIATSLRRRCDRNGSHSLDPRAKTRDNPDLSIRALVLPAVDSPASLPTFSYPTWWLKPSDGKQAARFSWR